MAVQRILDQYDVPRMLGLGAFGALMAFTGAHGAVHMTGVPNSYSAFLWLTPMAAVTAWLFLHSKWLVRTQSRPHRVVPGGRLVSSFWPDI